MYSTDEPADSPETNLFKDDLTDSKIHKHLSDESDRIEESDIANIQTGSRLSAAETAEINTATGETASKAEQEVLDAPIKDNNDPEIDTSWNVLQ